MLISIYMNLSMFILLLFEFTLTLYFSQFGISQIYKMPNYFFFFFPIKLDLLSIDKSMAVSGRRQAATLQWHLSCKTAFKTVNYVKGFHF